MLILFHRILQVNKRECTFSEEELVAILEDYFSNKQTQEEIGFEVKPYEIDQTLFQKERKNAMQERTRKLILEAFKRLENRPQKYGKNFRTLMPIKNYDSKTVDRLKRMASRLGDHNADWVEQSLEWAQRICNGESWEAICNQQDTATWFRMVIWKSGLVRLVGGSTYLNYSNSAADVSEQEHVSDDTLSYTVPLVVIYEK